MKEKKKKKNGNIRTRKSAVPPQGHQPIHRLFESRAEQSETLFVFCGPALRGWLPFTPIESRRLRSLSLSPPLSHSLSLDSPSNATTANNMRPSSSLFSSISLRNVEREESRFGGGALSRCRFRPYARLSRTLLSLSLFLSLSLSLSLARSSQDVQRIVHVPYFYERRAFVTRCRCKLKTPTD